MRETVTATAMTVTVMRKVGLRCCDGECLGGVLVYPTTVRGRVGGPESEAIMSFSQERVTKGNNGYGAM